MYRDDLLLTHMRNPEKPQRDMARLLNHLDWSLTSMKVCHLGNGEGSEVIKDVFPEAQVRHTTALPNALDEDCDLVIVSNATDQLGDPADSVPLLLKRCRWLALLAPYSATASQAGPETPVSWEWDRLDGFPVIFRRVLQVPAEYRTIDGQQQILIVLQGTLASPEQPVPHSELLAPSNRTPRLQEKGLNLLIGGMDLPYVKLMAGEYYDPDRIKVFHPDLEADIRFSLKNEGLRHVLSRLPEGWKPDVVLYLYPEYNPIPLGLEDCPYPLVGLVGDWNLGFRDLVPCLGMFDHLFGDANGMELCRKLGFERAHYWPAYSYKPAMQLPETEDRPFDITFIGNLNHSVQRERSRYLKLVATLAKDFRVNIQGGVFGDDYIRCFQQSKIVFNRSIRGELNLRCYEAPACGALLFLEDTNAEARSLFREGEDCVYYNDETLVPLLKHFLTHEEDRKRLARAGENRVRQSDYSAHFSSLLALLESRLGGAPFARPFKEFSEVEQHLFLARLAYRGTFHEGIAFAERLLCRAERLVPDHPEVIADLAAVYATQSYLAAPPGQAVLRAKAETYFRRALKHSPDEPVLCLNAGYFFLQSDRALAQELLERAVSASGGNVAGILAPFRYGHLVVETEGAFARCITQPEKQFQEIRNLIAWQAADWLGDISQDPAQAIHWYRLSTEARPDIGQTQAKLGKKLLQHSRFAEAIDSLQQALADNPLDMEAVLGLMEAYAAEKPQSLQGFYEDYAAVLKAIPQLSAHVEAFEAKYRVLSGAQVVLAPGPKATLIGTCVRQKPEILREYLASLDRLEIPAGRQCAYLFVDDNDDPASREILSAWVASRPADRPAHILYREDEQVYHRDDFTHQWTDHLVWKVARYKNEIIQAALHGGFENLFLIDSDLVMHPRTLSQLLSREVDVISNIFWTRWEPGAPEMPNVWIQDTYTFHRQKGSTVDPSRAKQEAESFIASLRVPGAYEVGGLGACTLISRQALAAGVNYAEIPNVSFWGEDRHFCVRAQVLGFKLWIETSYPSYHIYRDTDLKGVPAYIKSTAPVSTLTIDGLRGENFLLIADDQDPDWYRGLTSYVKRFAPDEDVSLLIYSRHLPHEELIARVEQQLEVSGFSPDHIPDILVMDQRLPEEREYELFGLVDGLYSPTATHRSQRAQQLGCRVISDFSLV